MTATGAPDDESAAPMTLLDERAPSPSGPKPVFEGTKKRGEQFLLYTFVIVPFLAFVAAVPVAAVMRRGAGTC